MLQDTPSPQLKPWLTVLVRWTASLFLSGYLLSAGGCEPKAERVFIYEFGGKRYRTLDETVDVSLERLQQAYRLYGQDRYADAARCVEAIFESRHGGEAYVLAGVIATRRGWHQTAEQYLRTAIEKCPRMVWAHEALVWHLCEAGDYERAEEYAVAITNQYVCREYWDILEAVRERRRQSERWIIVWLLLVLLVALIIFARGVYVLHQMDVEKQKKRTNSRCGS